MKCFLLLHLYRSIQRRIQDPVKYLERSFSKKKLKTKKILTSFAKGSITDVWRGPESASECNNIESYKNVTAEAVQKNENFHSIPTTIFDLFSETILQYF